MQKYITKFLILTIILTAALSVNYLFAAWTGPTQAPPGGNTPAPINVGSTNQVKDGGLSLDALSVFGGGYFQGNVGIGVVTPTEALEVGGNIKTAGGIEVGNTTNTNAGTIRWTGTDLEVYNGSVWTSLTSGEAAPAPLASADCDAAGGSWEGGQQICYFSGSGCPAGWTKKESYSSIAVGNTCNNDCVTGKGGYRGVSSSCTISPHFRENKGNTCSYERFLSTNNCSSRTRVTCSATITEIGCTKN